MKLVITLIVLLTFVLGWSWLHIGLCQEQLSDAFKKLDRCEAYAASIMSNRESNQDFGIASKDYDCSQDVIRILQSQRITSHKAISTGIQQTDPSGIVVKRISNPLKGELTMRQLVGMLRALNDNETRIRANSLELRSPTKAVLEGQPENWEIVELDLSFFSNDK